MHSIDKKKTTKLQDHVSLLNVSPSKVSNFYSMKTDFFDIYVPLLIECTEFLWDAYSQFSFQ